MCRLEKRTLRWPSLNKTPMCSRLWDIEVLTQLDKTSCDSSNRQNPIPSRVPSLAPRGFPPAIAGKIAKVVFDTAKRHTGWLLSHIGKELSERVEPLLAHCNSSLTVALKLAVVRIDTALNHVRPRGIGWAFRDSASVSVSVVRHNS